MAQMAILDHKVIQDRKVPLDLKGHREQREHKVLLDLLLVMLTKLSTKMAPTIPQAAQTYYIAPQLVWH
jgi:hypothetical protein